MQTTYIIARIVEAHKARGVRVIAHGEREAVGEDWRRIAGRERRTIRYTYRTYVIKIAHE